MDEYRLFSNYLSERELKITRERLTIFREILRTKKHFDPESLLQQLKRGNKKISHATVYRTLDLLVDAGLVKKTTFVNSLSNYEANINPKSHDHFICITCGRIVEFYDDELDRIHDRLSAEQGVEILNYSHQIYGKCKDCR